MPKPFKINDRVAYARNYLLTVGSSRAARRGTIIKIVTHSPGWTLATVQWEGEGGFCSDVNINNICRTNSKAFIE